MERECPSGAFVAIARFAPRMVYGVKWIKDAWRRFTVGLFLKSAGTVPVRQHPQG